jgi:hypothetical protein
MITSEVYRLGLKNVYPNKMEEKKNPETKCDFLISLLQNKKVLDV